MRSVSQILNGIMYTSSFYDVTAWDVNTGNIVWTTPTGAFSDYIVATETHVYLPGTGGTEIFDSKTGKLQVGYYEWEAGPAVVRVNGKYYYPARSSIQ